MRTETKKAFLQKIPFVLLIYVFGSIFCRYYQLEHELLYDGSLVEGAFMHRTLLILTVTFLLGFGFTTYCLKKLRTHSACFSSHPLPMILQAAAAAALICGNVMQLLSGREPASVYTMVSVALVGVLPYLGIASGICILAFALLVKDGKKPSPLLYMLTSVYLVVRLIVCFQEWNTDPSIHDYAYELLAAICSMLGCFQISGFGFDKGKRRIATFWCLCAVFFCSISIADLLGNTSELFINAGLLLLMLTHGLQLLYANEEIEEELPRTPAAEAAATEEATKLPEE